MGDVKLRFLGGAGTVTGSKYLIENGRSKILVDCGLFQGLKELRLRNREPLLVPPGSIDSVVLSHAHLDHSGYLPVLVKRGFRGKIHCTSATRDLCRILLPDSGRIQEEEAQYANEKGFSKHHPALPLYDEKEAYACLDYFRTHPFENDFNAAPGILCRLKPAGHILGASVLKIEVGGVSIAFSGDLGRPEDLIMKPPARIESADYLVVESTYGDRFHDTRKILDQLAEALNRTFARGGVVVAPAFSVGRSQALLYALYRLRKARKIPDVPIFLNSPMSVDATRLFSEYQGEHALDPKECAGMCSVATYIHTIEESKALNRASGPMMIISASGMATGGRVLHHLRAFAPDPKNMILLAGFQAKGTRGASLIDGAKTLRIHGMDVPVGAEVAVLHGFSAHADQGEILEWLGGFRRPPKQTFITHGEPEAAQSLRREIEGRLGWSCVVPAQLEEYELT